MARDWGFQSRSGLRKRTADRWRCNIMKRRASKELRAIPGVRNFGSHIGRAEVADEVVGPNFTELWIRIDPNAPYEPTVAKIQEVVDGYPGLVRDLLTYLKERIKEVLTGAGASIVVRIYGPGDSRRPGDLHPAQFVFDARAVSPIRCAEAA